MQDRVQSTPESLNRIEEDWESCGSLLVVVKKFISERKTVKHSFIEKIEIVA